jgi:hypothetical protein
MGVGGARGDHSREDIEFLAVAQMYGWDGAVGRDEALARRGRDVGGGLCGLFGRRHCTVGLLTLVVFLAYDTVLLVPWFTAKQGKAKWLLVWWVA